VQDDNEQFTTLTVNNQKHIGVNFTSAELTMQLDDFAERVLKPRISQLASSSTLTLPMHTRPLVTLWALPVLPLLLLWCCCKPSRS
jgi:hypothetical protein